MKKFFSIITLFFLFLLSPSIAQAAPLSSSSYTYDNVGNIKKIEDKVDPTKTVDFNYDQVYRLESASGGYTSSYVYNADGEITTKNEGTQAVTLGYAESSPALHAPKTINGKTLVYDQNGNLIEDTFSDLTIVYDYDNKPVEIKRKTTGSTLAKYYYDGQAKRVKKEVYDNGVLKTTTYYISGNFEKEVPISGTPKVRKFYQGVAYREGDTLTYITTDPQSSTTMTLNTSGGKTAEYRYYPYGSPITPSSPLPPNSWIGQKRDDETGLYFLNARYYNSIFGRFVTSDMVEDPSVRGNRYIYSANNPVVLADPGGDCPICLIPLVLGGMILGGATYESGIAPNQNYQANWNQSIGPAVFGNSNGDYQTAAKAGNTVANVGVVGGILFQGGYATYISLPKSSGNTVLGNGGQGTVTRGPFGTAIKTFNDSKITSMQYKALTDNPGVYPRVILRGRSTIIMEEIKGTPLDVYLNDGGTITPKMAEGLIKQLNRLQTPHGDLIDTSGTLKYNNLMVAGGELRLIDPIGFTPSYYKSFGISDLYGEFRYVAGELQRLVGGGYVATPNLPTGDAPIKW